MKRQAKNSSNNNSLSSVFLNHEPCPSCGSRDNLARFDDGHGYCFGCQHYEHSTSSPQHTQRTTSMNRSGQGLIKVEFADIPKILADDGGMELVSSKARRFM